MSLTSDDPRAATSNLTLPVAAVVSAFLIFAVLQAMALNLTGGVFEYPLDDPYIHLAISETIAAGGYGVNTQELSSPGSSPLFPILLIPFHGTELHRFMPLFWNVVGLGLTAWLWGTLLAEAAYGRDRWRWLGLAAAVVGPFALMMPMVAYVGMEHALQTAAAMAIILGLHRHLDDKGGVALILAGAFFGSALRLEALALTFLAGGALVFTGKRGAGALTFVAGILPIALFMGFLVSRGLDPLPSSVQSKLAMGGIDSPSLLERRLAVVWSNVAVPAGKLILAMTVAALLVWRGAPALRAGRWSAFAAVVVLAALAHLFFGQMGWLNRYEQYILVVTAAGLLALLPKVSPDAPGLMPSALVVAVLAGGFLAYKLPGRFIHLPEASRAIHLQQSQMATFAKDYLKTDVAVNDLGWVAWQNPNYVLDLWGLASAEARERRLTNPSPGWTGEMTEAYGVPAALVYDHWFDDGIGADWVRVGRLSLTVPGGFLGGRVVAFYATGPEHVTAMQDAVKAWLPTLEDGSEWTWDRGMEP